MAVTYVDQPAVVGATIDWQLVVRKNKVDFDIEALTVTLMFTKPSGTDVGPLAVTDKDGNIASYTNLSTLFDVTGVWKMQWTLSNGSTVVLKTKAIDIQVYPSLQ